MMIKNPGNIFKDLPRFSGSCIDLYRPLVILTGSLQILKGFFLYLCKINSTLQDFEGTIFQVRDRDLQRYLPDYIKNSNDLRRFFQDFRKDLFSSYGDSGKDL